MHGCALRRRAALRMHTPACTDIVRGPALTRTSRAIVICEAFGRCRIPAQTSSRVSRDSYCHLMSSPSGKPLSLPASADVPCRPHVATVQVYTVQRDNLSVHERTPRNVDHRNAYAQATPGAELVAWIKLNACATYASAAFCNAQIYHRDEGYVRTIACVQHVPTAVLSVAHEVVHTPTCSHPLPAPLETSNISKMAS